MEEEVIYPFLEHGVCAKEACVIRSTLRAESKQTAASFSVQTIIAGIFVSVLSSTSDRPYRHPSGLVEFRAIRCEFWGATSTVIGWFQLFQKNRAIGVLDDAFLDIPGAALLIPLFLALFAALRRANRAWMAVATSLALAGVAAYVATNTSISLLYVSDQYWAATTDAQRSLFLAAGQATISAGGYGLLESTGSSSSS